MVYGVRAINVGQLRLIGKGVAFWFHLSSTYHKAVR